jgi:hypothetical protein
VNDKLSNKIFFVLVYIKRVTHVIYSAWDEPAPSCMNDMQKKLWLETVKAMY